MRRRSVALKAIEIASRRLFRWCPSPGRPIESGWARNIYYTALAMSNKFALAGCRACERFLPEENDSPRGHQEHKERAISSLCSWCPGELLPAQLRLQAAGVASVLCQGKGFPPRARRFVVPPLLLVNVAEVFVHIGRF